MRGTKSTLTRREFLELSGLGILALAATRCSPNLMSPTLQPLPSETVIPPSATATETPLPTITSTPEPSPTPSETPLPDWDGMDEGTLLNSAPRKEGYQQERVYGLDQGRVVTYKNQETGAVEWVFNTENKSFERAAESVWMTPVGVELHSLIVVSKEYAENVADLKVTVPPDDAEKLSKLWFAKAATCWADQPEGSLDERILREHMTDEQKSVLVGDIINRFQNEVVATGEEFPLERMYVGVDKYVFRFCYDRNVGIFDPAMDDLMDDSLVNTGSRGNSDTTRDFVQKLETSGDVLEPVLLHDRDANWNEVITHAYPANGMIVKAIGSLGNIFTSGIEGGPEFRANLWPQIREFASLDADFGRRPSDIYNPTEHPNYRAHHGDWLVCHLENV